MRRIVIAILLPLAALLGSIVAMSAFEVHAVNVRARVSTSVTVTATQGTALGTQAEPAGPLTWQRLPFEVSLSTSFLEQGRVREVEYKVCAQPKPNTYPDPDFDFAFIWMGGATFLEMDPAMPNSGPFFWIGPTTDINPPVGPSVACPVGAVGNLASPGDMVDTVYLWLEVPVFQGFYDPDDSDAGDAKDKPRNDSADCGSKTDGQPCVILPVPPAAPGGTQLGLDLVVQPIVISP